MIIKKLNKIQNKNKYISIIDIEVIIIKKLFIIGFVRLRGIFNKIKPKKIL